MRKIVVLTFITLDGVIQAPGGEKEDRSGGFKHGGWTVGFWDKTMDDVMIKQMQKPFSLLLGRKTYDIFASYWPKHEDQWPGVNGAAKYVVSKKALKLKWENSTLIKGNVAREIKKLKQTKGPDLQVYGSSGLIQTLLKNDLVDELWLKIFPITIGKGKKLFREGTIPAAFKLIESKISPKGVIAASYRRDGMFKTGTIGEQ